MNKESRGKKRKESNEAEASKKKSKSKAFCWCKKYREEEMLGCDGDDDDCPGNGWYHPSCVGLTAEDVEALDTWVCNGCK